MAKICRVAQNSPDDPEFMFDCPACGMPHWFKTTGSRPKWTWNGDFENPTVQPSLNVTWEQHGVQKRCHFYIQNGKIKFLGDCTHSMAKQTIPLADIPC